MTDQLLEERLSTLAGEAPDAGRIVSRVLAPPARRRSSVWPRVTISAVAAVAMIGLVAYFVPAASTVVARVPIAGDVVGAHDHVTVVGDSATSNGYTVTLVAAFADATRTELIFHVTPAASADLGVSMKDQFGRTYAVSSSFADISSGIVRVQLEPLAVPTQLTGARITLHISQLHPGGDPGASVAGSWTLHATLGVDEGTSVALPGPMTLARARLNFTSIVYTPESVAVDLEITGVSMEDLEIRVPDDQNPKGSPVFTVDLVDGSGTSILGTTSENQHWWSPIHVHLLGDRNESKSFSIVVSYMGQSMTRTFAVS